MNPQDPVHVFCTLIGIVPDDLAIPSRIMKLDPLERNPARIEDAARACFIRVRSVQDHIPTEHGQWMLQVIAHARSAMLRAATAPSVPRPVQPTPIPAWTSQAVPHTPAAAPQQTESPIIIRTHVPRYHRGLSWQHLTGAMGALVMCGIVLLGVGWFINEWWKDLNHKTQRKTNAKPSLMEATPIPPAVGAGGGRPAVSQKKSPRNSGHAGDSVARAASRDSAEARETLERAVILAQQGSFEEALRLAQRAANALPDVSEGLSFMIEYVKQYTKLADQARQALNGNCTVDLGPPYGTGQFVGQDTDEITFFLQGRHKKFSIGEFNGRKGVRFRVTRDFLDNADTPANDLILGSYHFLLQVNVDGEQDESKGVREAEGRFREAITSTDPAMVEQGMLMLTAMKALSQK